LFGSSLGGGGFGGLGGGGNGRSNGGQMSAAFSGDALLSIS
jgi:hypothetical protein